MTRYVVVTPVTVAASGYAQPARVLTKGQVVELSSSEVSTIGGGNLRTTVARDTLGLNAAVSNSD